MWNICVQHLKYISKRDLLGTFPISGKSAYNSPLFFDHSTYRNYTAHVSISIFLLLYLANMDSLTYCLIIHVFYVEFVM